MNLIKVYNERFNEPLKDVKLYLYILWINKEQKAGTINKVKIIIIWLLCILMLIDFYANEFSSFINFDLSQWRVYLHRDRAGPDFDSWFVQRETLYFLIWMHWRAYLKVNIIGINEIILALIFANTIFLLRTAVDHGMW